MRRPLGYALLAACSALSLSLAPDAKLKLTVVPSVAHAPARIFVTATVQRDEGNRAVEIVADSADFYRSSTVPLDGKRAARTTIVRFDDLPLGHYQIKARLLGADERVRESAAQALIVADPREPSSD